jgi:hypothetical protein
MRTACTYIFLTAAIATNPFYFFLQADTETKSSADIPSKLSGSASQSPAFHPFTGKITKNKVRMRIQPSLDGTILRELNKDELLIVVGEGEDFYKVAPPEDLKAYVFRTYILDNVVEGDRVNVRAEPNLEAPIVAQLNSGDKVEGTVSTLNSKWLEISPPSSAHFYVSKEFVEKLGDASLLGTIQRRREEVNALLNSTYLLSQSEMQKPFEKIQLEKIVSNFQKVIMNFSDFPDQVGRAKQLLSSIQEHYLEKKIAFLETRSRLSKEWQAKNMELTAEMKSQQERLQQLENKLLQATATEAGQPAIEAEPIGFAAAMVDRPRDISTAASIREDSKVEGWLAAENKLFELWQAEHPGTDISAFYQEQLAHAQTIKGIIEVYPRTVKNKPGDYLLLHPTSKKAIAYLYSTRINLQNSLGKEVVLRVAERPNNGFAFQAYYVLGIGD